MFTYVVIHLSFYTHTHTHTHAHAHTLTRTHTINLLSAQVNFGLGAVMSRLRWSKCTDWDVKGPREPSEEP